MTFSKYILISVVVIAAFSLLGQLVLLRTAVDHNNDAVACIKNANKQRVYVHNKLCDPFSDEVCHISPQAKEELNRWFVNAINRCNDL